MRVTREKAAAHRAAVVKAASDMFRARGLDGVGVAEIMQAAGLTHGGFYGHFASKDALVAEACREAFAEGVARVGKDADRKAYVTRYMSQRHRDRPDGGCPIASLGAEIARQEPAVQGAFTEGVAGYLDGVTALMQRSTDLKPKAARAEAIATLSAMVGAMVLARATAEADPDLSEEILGAIPAALAR